MYLWEIVLSDGTTCAESLGAVFDVSWFEAGRVKQFSLVGADTNVKIDMSFGTIIKGNEIISVPDYDSKEAKLIYFKRHGQIIGTHGIVLSKSCVWHAGIEFRGIEYVHTLELQSRRKTMWIALYNTGNCISQFNIDDSENKFDILELNKIKKFVVKTESHEAIVNLDNGEFLLDGIKLNCIAPEGQKRLIYYKTCIHSIGPSAGASKEKYHLGWQMTIDGKNIKRILSIDDNGFAIQCE